MPNPRATIYRNLAVTLEAGLPIRRALDTAASGAPRRFRGIFADMVSFVAAGNTLAAAMARHRRVFGPLDILIVETGEYGGNLPGAFAQLAHWYDMSARMARITLYEYFPNKEEIAWAIFQALIEKWYTNLDDFLALGGTGFQQIEHFLMQVLESGEQHPEHFRFIVEFNTLYALQEDAARLLELFPGGSDHPLTRIIREGIRDGSLRPDLDPGLTASAVGNLIAGMSSRFALLGNQITQEYGYPWKRIYLEIIHTFLRGIQSTVS